MVLFPMKSPLLPLLALLGGFSIHAQEFNPRKVVRPFDPITEPNIVAASESDSWVKDGELILGVVVGEKARAYPINMLTNPSREIINDTLGGQPIAATW